MGALVDALFDALAFLIDKLLVSTIELAVDLAQWGVDQLPSVFGDIDLSGRLAEIWAWEGVACAVYLVPIAECFAIFVITLNAVAIIRGLRFVIGWFPTIEG